MEGFFVLFFKGPQRTHAEGFGISIRGLPIIVP